ncbi:hypothetical protein QYM36_019702 [Artemia franciscana]|uniref:Uncharacterized protein n=1 Tax=Artemia franciscana TaxID=6661 RepID=A0AA88HA47_ARTSF|nr:hypothetical protein QYM36_019702 [Artemia franciscana]
MNDLIEAFYLESNDIFDNYEASPKKNRVYPEPELGNLYSPTIGNVDTDNIFAQSTSDPLLAFLYAPLTGNVDMGNLYAPSDINSDTSALSSSDPPTDNYA